MRAIKFRAWDKKAKKFYNESAVSFDILKGASSETSAFVFQQYTGFKDKNGREIYEGDIISDYVETDEGIKKSHYQVFWNHERGAWHIDNSFKQDMSSSQDLWFELHDFEYEVSVNIFNKSKSQNTWENATTSSL